MEGLFLPVLYSEQALGFDEGISHIQLSPKP